MGCCCTCFFVWQIWFGTHGGVSMFAFRVISLLIQISQKLIFGRWGGDILTLKDEMHTDMQKLIAPLKESLAVQIKIAWEDGLKECQAVRKQNTELNLRIGKVEKDNKCLTTNGLITLSYSGTGTGTDIMQNISHYTGTGTGIISGKCLFTCPK